MKASILVVGDELLGGRCQDTNSGWLCSRLRALGLEIVEGRCGPDDQSWIASAMSDLAKKSDLVLVTGGLGPTPDDLTREGLSIFLADPLVVDEEAFAWIQEHFSNAGLEMGPSQSRLAMRPSGAACFPNHVGTAPSILSRDEGTAIWLLPGPPRELHDAWERHVKKWLVTQGQRDQVVKPITIKCFGLIEADLESRLGSLADRSHRPLAGTRISQGEFHLHLDPCGVDQASMDECARRARSQLHPYDFGQDAQTLPQIVGVRLKARGETLSTAESCTAGLISSAIVGVSGSSEWFHGGWVVYSNQMKQSCLDVSSELIERDGAVSREVVESLARAATSQSGSDWALAVSGVAGPGGGTPEKPVGTVWIACHGPGMSHQRCFRFSGDRSVVRHRSMMASLQMLRWSLEGVDPLTPMSWDVAND